MKRILLPTPGTIFRFYLRTLAVLLFGIGVAAPATAQCIGPYQNYESFVKSGTAAPFADDLIAKGWTTSALYMNITNGVAAARSGSGFVSLTSTGGGYLQTPKLATPDKFQFYYRSQNTTVSTIRVAWSTDVTFATGVSFTDIVTTGTNYISSGLIGLSPLTDVYVRITHLGGTGAAVYIEDVSWTSTTASDNKIIVPALGNTTCDPVTVPAAAGPYKYSFYDQGGSTDTYNKSQTQIIHFAPSVIGEKVKLTFNACTLDALIPVGTIVTNITVYNGNGTTGGTEFPGLNAVTSVIPTTSVTSSDTSGYITVKFITTNSTGTLSAAIPGFDATVECVGSPTITGLTGSGCAGGPLVITGTNLGGATVVTVGGVAVSAIGANTATSLTVTPAAGSSGTVFVSTPGGTVTSAGSYTVNAVPTISSQPSSGTQTICLNGASTALSVTAAAGSGAIQKYEWYSNTSASTTGGTLVATTTTAATTTTYTPLTTAVGTLYYYVVVTNSNGCSVTSTFTGAITVNAPVVITGQPSTTVQSVCVGLPITALSVTATGGGLTYQWYSNTANSTVGGTSLGVAGQTATYTPSNASAMATTYYYCVVSNGAPCSSAATSAVSGGITVNALPTAVTVSGGGAFCTNTTLTAANGGSGTMYYQGTTSGGTSTATAATTQVVNASGTYYFRAFNGSCWSTEGSATVTINAAPGSAPASAVPTGVTANSFTGSWTAVVGATGYYLDVSTNVGFTGILPAYSNLAIGNVLTYTVTGLNPSTQYFYRVRANNGTCSGPSSTNFQNCTTAALVYCLPNGSGFGQDPQGITNVTMGSINNTTGIEATNYGNYTALGTSVFVGATQPFSVTYRTGYTYDTTVWVDWNNDGDFGDVGELVYQGNSTNAVPTTLSGSFAVPLLNSDGVSTVGSHRVRIGGIDFGPLTDPCRANSWQAFEDYTLNVLTVPPCAVSTPSALTSVNVVATGASLVWSDPAMTPNTVYNYWVSTSNTAPAADGSNPVGMGTVTGALSANVSGLTLGVTYYFWVRVKCSAGSYSAWVGSATFTTANLDVVNMTGGSISTCNAKFYDSGSFSGSYSNNENSTYTFTSNSGTNLKVVFNSFVTEPNFDFLSIYDGPTVGSTLLGTFSGSQIAAGQAFYSSGTSLTFKFTSDISITPAGWDANITCVNVPTVTGFSPLFACVGSAPTITINGTNFTGASAVSFNGVAASSYTVVNSTTITATLPVGATTGVIRVTTPTASGVSTASFAVRPIPATPNAGADVVFCNGQSTNLNIVVPPASNTLATTQLGGNGCTGGNMFNIVTGPSPVSITSFDITPNSSGVQSVRVYYRTGTYVGNETTTAAWTLLGTYSVNGVAKVLINMPVTNLPLLASTTYGIYINYDASYTDGNNSYTNGEITINTGAGLCALFGSVNASRTFNGVVNYQVTATPTYTWTPATGLSSATIVNPVASPTSTTTYSVTTTINGCTSPSDSVVVTVNPVPTTTIPTASANVCANSVIPVTVSGSATTYTWTSSVANTLFTDATGLTPYVAGSNTTAIYVKTPVTATITATGTILPGGCFTTAAVTFTVVTKTYNAPFWNPAPPVNDGTENLVFNAGNYTSSGDLSACSCTVNGATANVTFNSGHTLSLVNGLTVSAGAVTFNSGASLVQTNPVANTGNITYKRDSTPCFKNDYTYWSSPVAGQTLIGLSPATGSTGFFDYNAGISNWQQTPYASVMSLGKGYLIRVPASYPVSPALPINFTANFVGVPNNGTVPVNIVYNAANSLNLIGNPYPSAINAAKLVTDPGFNVNGSFLGGTIYLWSHNSNVNYVTGQYNQTDYAVWNILGGVNTYYTGFVGAGNSNAPNGNIAAGQGFFIKTVGSGTAYFRNSMRTGGATNINSNFYRTNAPVAALDPTADYEKHRIWLDVTNGVAAYKQLLVGYVQDGTDGLDRLFDGEMVDNGNTVSLYTTVENKKLSIQGRGLTFTPNDSFALGFKTTVAASYSINLSDFDGLFLNQSIYLEDKLLNVIHDLKVSPYAFTSAVGVFEDRFVLRFTNETLGTTTPVFNENSVVVYKNEQGLIINSGSENMKNVYIYDIRGRLLASQKQVGNTSTVFTNLPATQQVLLVKIEGENGGTVTKKIVF